MKPRCIRDPIEKIVATALDKAGVAYVHESEDPAHTGGLDFRTWNDVYIECKAYHACHMRERAACLVRETNYACSGLDADSAREDLASRIMELRP